MAFCTPQSFQRRRIGLDAVMFVIFKCVNDFFCLVILCTYIWCFNFQMDEFKRDLENYLVELYGSSFPLDEDIFLEDAESCCSTLSSKFDDLSDEEDVDEGFAVSSDGESENQYCGADDRLSSDDDDVYAQMRRNAREAEGSMEM